MLSTPIFRAIRRSTSGTSLDLDTLNHSITRPIDAQNEAEYMEELVKITEQINIKKLSLQIEQSKIYVDVEGVKSKLGGQLEESYSKYIFLQKNPQLNNLPAHFIEMLLKKMSDGGALSGVVTIPPTEADYILLDMISEIRDLFVSSSDHGLDFYISTRIRHGTLAGQLRGTLDALHLVTYKDAKTKSYKDNDYWPEVLSRSNISLTEDKGFTTGLECAD